MQDTFSDFESREWTEANHPALNYQDMLADTERMGRYRRAIESVVRPGDVVADLGTGLGVLALFAVRAGAELVYAIDLKPSALWLAERIVRANGAEGRVRLVEGDARTLELGRSVDCIVSELIGTFGTDEGMYESVRAFATRHLAPGGRVVPARLQTFLVPVEYRGGFRAAFRADNEGLDLRPALETRLRPGAVIHPLRAAPRELAPPARVEDIRFGSDMPERVMTREVKLTVDRSGTLQGLVGYFRADLTDEIELRNHPPYPDCHWQHWNWPVSPPLDVEPGDSFACELRMTARTGGAVGWNLAWSRVPRSADS